MGVGLLRPHAGTARIFGVDVWAEPMEARRLVGVLPTTWPCRSGLTGHEVLTYLGLMRDARR